MSSFADKLYQNSPKVIQECMITLFNLLAYKKRYGKVYAKFLKFYNTSKNLSLEELLERQNSKLLRFIEYSNRESEFYNDLYNGIPLKSINSANDLHLLPIVNKELLRQHIKKVYTLKKEEGIISKTGGTTGKSLEVVYCVNDLQERFAILDSFRGQYGYKLRKKTAWFSGKNLLSKKDINKNRFWKTDFYYNVRYYSTFHIHKKYLTHYLNDLIRYKPEYMVGFPSSMYELAKHGIESKYCFPENTIKAIFPTAETVTKEIRNTLEGFFKTKIYDQYASSEGAPFITECELGKLHMNLQSGVFEVLDENDEYSTKGRLIVTSFTTHGTPLIRYDIGDSIELDDGTCSCGNKNPLVKQILGRVSDFIYSEETGKINLGNISNCLKGVNGVIRFQIIQLVPHKIEVYIETDDRIFNSKYERIFRENLRDRVGNAMEICIIRTEKISVEKSGKYRLVKNMITQH